MLFFMILSSISFHNFLAYVSLINGYFSSLEIHNRIVPHAKRLILVQSFSSTFYDLLSSSATSNSCWKRTSCTSHCHMPKLLVPSNFSTSNLVLVTIDLDENPFDVEVDSALDSNYDISTTNSCHCGMFYDVEDQITLQPQSILRNYRAKNAKSPKEPF